MLRRYYIELMCVHHRQTWRAHYGLSGSVLSVSPSVSLHEKHRSSLEVTPLCAQERYLGTLDSDALAAHIRTSVPSLLTVSIRLMGHPTHPPATAIHGVEWNAVPVVCESSGV